MTNNINLPIRGISIYWDRIDNYSYLRNIEAIKGLDYISFSNTKARLTHALQNY